MEEVRSSESLVSYNTTWSRNPEDLDLNFHRRQNFSSRTVVVIVLIISLSQVPFPLIILLRLQVSDCSTFLIKCDVPSTAVLLV